MRRVKNKERERAPVQCCGFDFKVKDFIPRWIESLPLDLRFAPLRVAHGAPVDRDHHKRIRRASLVHGNEVLARLHVERDLVLVPNRLDSAGDVQRPERGGLRGSELSKHREVINLVCDMNEMVLLLGV